MGCTKCSETKHTSPSVWRGAALNQSALKATENKNRGQISHL